MEQALIFDIKKYAIHDGPGIRTTIFFKGCALRCPWCHNPEGIKKEMEIIIFQDRCIQCEDCINVCSKGALICHNGVISIDRKECDLCGACREVCHTRAIEIVGRQLTVEEALREIEKDVLFYDESGGGVTFSGGEPLMQPNFLEALLRECKHKGIHTTLDTSGYTSVATLRTVSEFVDLFLYDVKIMDDQRHMHYTGVSNEYIMSNLQELSQRNKSINIRIPVIPEINDDDKNIKAIGAFLASLPHIHNVSLLPYHRAWVDKFNRLGGEAEPYIVEPPSKEKIEKIKNILQGFGLAIDRGG
ncbi:MAG: glycyl-radical enzyme activating protein [candidate division WOR-3 bacterium]|nr:MAG: glycyl-radical enzyme activating protein [candidate division WOR-3 bacterium]